MLLPLVVSRLIRVYRITKGKREFGESFCFFFVGVT